MVFFQSFFNRLLQLPQISVKISTHISTEIAGYWYSLTLNVGIAKLPESCNAHFFCIDFEKPHVLIYITTIKIIADKNLYQITIKQIGITFITK